MRVFIWKKGQFIFGVFSVAVVIMAGLFLLSPPDTAQAGGALRGAGKRLPIYGVNTQEKEIALTFDCAWENSGAEALLKVLSKNDARATFFVTGDWCERYPDEVKAIYNAGHAVENHSYSHPHPTKLCREDLLADTTKCDELISGLTGKTPTLYRAPYGEYSDEMLETFDSDLPHKVIQWDVDSRDWQGKTVGEMEKSVMKNAKNGSILLFHNDTKNTTQALAAILPALADKGYSFILVEELIYKTGYTLDNEGRQVKKP